MQEKRTALSSLLSGVILRQVSISSGDGHLASLGTSRGRLLGDGEIQHAIFVRSLHLLEVGGNGQADRAVDPALGALVPVPALLGVILLPLRALRDTQAQYIIVDSNGDLILRRNVVRWKVSRCVLDDRTVTRVDGT